MLNELSGEGSNSSSQELVKGLKEVIKKAQGTGKVGGGKGKKVLAKKRKKGEEDEGEDSED
jgi:hypothetical protein